ncbi:MAG TPA: DUF1684 domain-containing protein [Saprospiraceae bacterium]|nr:DUF1684 domain-containing protein [Saprospiraceae bacterium]
MIRYIILYSICIVLAGCSSPFAKEISEYRQEYKSEFLKDPRSPLKEADFDKLDFYPASEKARLTASFKATENAEPFDMPTYSGLTRKYRKWGEATFTWGNQNATLALFENLSLLSNPDFEDYLFLPFKDETNGVTTYGGGRYLNMSKADTEDGTIIIDFNKCYNPYCAYSDGFNCPIPPRENNLPFMVQAGEKNFKGAYTAVGH